MFTQMTFKTNTPFASEALRSNEREATLSHKVTTLVNHVATTDEYRFLRGQNVPHTEAFTKATEAIITSPDNGFSAADTALLDVTSRLGTFIEAEKELEALQSERAHGKLPQQDFDHMKLLKREHAIPFNHSLKNLINESPNLSLKELSGALTNAHTAVFARYNSLHPTRARYAEDIPRPGDVAYRLENNINAMRHEVAVESILDAANVPYDYTISVEEDAKGVDIVVYLDGKRLPIDIKSSRMAEERGVGNYPDKRAVWSQLMHEDFTGIKGSAPGSLSIPYTTATAKSASLVSRIRSADAGARAYIQGKRSK